MKRPTKPHDRIALPTDGCCVPATQRDVDPSDRLQRDPLPKAQARSLLTGLTAQMLLRGSRPVHCPEEVGKFNAQIVFAYEYLRSVADRLVLTPAGTFPESVVHAAIQTVATAYETFCATEPLELQQEFNWYRYPWRENGIRIN